MKTLKADWLTEVATQRIFTLLEGFPTFVVGGCVRNTLLSEPVKDIDFATAARPDTVVRLAEAAGLRVVPTGLAHGTVTVIADGVPFEITTFRRDVETDGRRAVVSFAETMQEDASRRDFTVNAIYVDAKGTLHDPVGGLKDIGPRRIRFIEDAETRIQEDYLRSLRFFRFSAWYGDPQTGMDSEALNAIARNIAGLETLSRERIGSELLRLLAAPEPCPALAAMRMTGVLNAVLPGSDDSSLGPLVELERILSVAPDPLRRLAVLGGATDRLRLSRAQFTNVSLLREASSMGALEAGYRHGFDMGRDTLLVLSASLSQHVSQEDLSAIEKASKAKFPICASDLMPEYSGPALGMELRRRESQWIESGFTLSRDELLSQG